MCALHKRWFQTNVCNGRLPEFTIRLARATQHFLVPRTHRSTASSTSSWEGYIVNKFLIGLALSLGCVAASANTGIAFVHGTGKQTNALDDYWTRENVDSIRQGMPNTANYVIINCDFTQYMWNSAAAGCLAGQLSSFIQAKGSGFKEADVRTGSQKRSQRSKGRDQGKKHHRRDS